MHYSSYSPVCHFLLQDPSLHCIEYYPLVSSDSSINHHFVLFVEPGIHAEVLQSMLPTFLFKKRERSAFVSSFCHYAGHRLVEVNKTVQTIQACTASVEQALVPGHPPPQASSGPVIDWCCLCLLATREEAVSKTSALFTWKTISLVHSVATRRLSAYTIAL